MLCHAGGTNEGKGMNPIAITDAVAALLPVCAVVTTCSALPGDGACSAVTFHIYWGFTYQDPRDASLERTEKLHREHKETVLELAAMEEEECMQYANALAAGFVDSLTSEQAAALRSEIELHRFTIRGGK